MLSLEQQVGPGQCLPSERELCQALNEPHGSALRNPPADGRGAVYSKASVGTFVAEPKIRRPLQTYIPFGGRWSWRDMCLPAKSILRGGGGGEAHRG